MDGISIKIWEEAIQELEARDRQKPPPKCAILFVGDSNIRRWKLENNFSDLPVINCGFGGSMIADVVYYADRIVIPHRPKKIVLCGGVNDVASGHKTPQQVLADYREFVKMMHAVLPKTRVVYISLPHLYCERDDPEANDKVTLVNRLIHDACEMNKRLEFVNVNEVMADEDGKPRGELFLADGIHTNETGYKLWASCLRPHLSSQTDQKK